MTTLDINTNGSWRTVTTDLGQADIEAVKAACITITNASVRTTGSRRGGVTWRLRDAFSYAFAHLQHSSQADGTVTTAWKFK